MYPTTAARHYPLDQPRQLTSRFQPALPTLLDDRSRDARVRQAALHAYASLSPNEAPPILVREGDDPLLTADAVKLLGRLGDERGLAFLDAVAEKHYNAWTRKEAKQAARNVRTKN